MASQMVNLNRDQYLMQFKVKPVMSGTHVYIGHWPEHSTDVQVTILYIWIFEKKNYKGNGKTKVPKWF